MHGAFFPVEVETRLGVGGINSVAGDHFGARELQANFKAVTKKKGILLFLREGTRGSYSLEKYRGPCNLAESCRVRGRALCIFKAVTKKKGILLFLREGNRCSYSLEKCWGPCNLAESCSTGCWSVSYSLQLCFFVAMLIDTFEFNYFQQGLVSLAVCPFHVGHDGGPFCHELLRPHASFPGDQVVTHSE